MWSIRRKLVLSMLSVGIYFLILFLLLFGMIMIGYNLTDTSLSVDIDNTKVNDITHVY